MPEAGTRHVIAVTSALALLGTTLILLFCTEPIAVRFWFALAVTAGIISFVTLLSRRLLFASVIAFSLVALVFLVSLEKQATMNMGLHSYDLFFYLNADTLEFLWSDYRRYVVGVLSVLAIVAILATLACRFDATRLSRLVSGVALVLAVTVAGAFEPQASAEGGAFRLFTQDNSFVSAFYLSWSETWGTLVRGQLMEAAARTTLPDFASVPQCKPRLKPPHIVLIHQESLVPPSLFPQLQYDRALDRFFLSDDGRLHRLRVETYGGGSWVTEFALLTGISTKAFGDMRLGPPPCCLPSRVHRRHWRRSVSRREAPKRGCVVPTTRNPGRNLHLYDEFLGSTGPDRLQKIFARYELFRLAQDVARCLEKIKCNYALLRIRFEHYS